MNAKKLIGALAVGSLLMSGVAFAQTGSTTTTGSSTNTSTVTGSTTPGAPNTGAGGDMAQNLALLATSGVIALAGMAYLSRRAAVR